MSTAATFTLSEFHRMIDSGAFVGLHKRIELIRGELRMMSPQGVRHAEVVSQLGDWSYDVIDRGRIRIRIQSPIEISGLNTEPEPVVVWADKKHYSQHPQPHEILLVIEVADHSLIYDLGEKRDLYAEAGIREYWVADIPNRTIHVFRDPRDGTYQVTHRFSAGATVNPLLVNGVTCVVSHLFGCLDV